MKVNWFTLLFFRKKRVTDHWRRYVSPLTWRTKWIELRMKQMKSQLSKYERELESYAQKEQQLELGQCTSGDCSMKLLPYSGQNHKKEVMKRRRRKKIEDMVDLSLYMSHHNLFSYYGIDGPLAIYSLLHSWSMVCKFFCNLLQRIRSLMLIHLMMTLVFNVRALFF